jgi:DNA (cytosine-5)-methyltransferase 1
VPVTSRKTDAGDADLAFLRRSTPPAPARKGDPVPIVDLFASCGGLTIGALEGARRAGRPAELVLGVDKDPIPLEVLRATIGAENGRARTADLETTLSRSLNGQMTLAEAALLADVPDDALLLAGPPCQGHSALNNHTRHDDSRNDLYLAVARVARLIAPKAIVVENVTGVGSDRRRAVGRCVTALENLGYSVDTQRINTLDMGVPQRRIRHVLIATIDRFDWSFPSAPKRTVAWAIQDLLEKEGDSVFDSPSRQSPENRDRIEWLFRNRKHNLPNPERPRCHRVNDDHSYLSMYGRLKWNEPAQTITTGFGSMGQGRFVHPKRHRTLTPHEAARLQFLPDFLRLHEVESRGALARMIGNAVPAALPITIIRALIAQDLL